VDIFKKVVADATFALRLNFPQLSTMDIAAILGNGAHESGGFTIMQERNPTVKGSAGGYGYFQWTGPRRRAFTAWCKQNGLQPDDMEANIGFLIYELKTSESRAIPAVRKAKTLDEKVVAFELGYERAGVKHYESRKKWALKALQLIPQKKQVEPELEAMIPPPPKSLVKSKTIWSTIASYVSGGAATTLAALNGMDWKVLAVLIVGGTLTGLVIWERLKKE